MTSSSSTASPERRCFLHVPKSGGTSVFTALEGAFPPGAVSPRRQDETVFCYGFEEWDQLGPEAREVVAVGPAEIEEMRSFPVISGHFAISTLRSIVDTGSIATILREPRSRLLSTWAFWRLTPELQTAWRAYPIHEQGRRPLQEFLNEPQIAPAVDNIVCRMLLHGDPRIPKLDFIAPADIEAVAERAVEVLGTFGYVGVLELGESIWSGLSQFFGVPLAPTYLNSTASRSTYADSPAADLDITARTLDLLEARTAADAILYRHALMSAGCSVQEAERLRAAAFASELARIGDIAGTFATQFRAGGRALEALNAEVRHEREQIEQQGRLLADMQRDLDQVRDQLQWQRTWLDGIQRSASWRLTAPLRAAKQAVRALPARIGGPRGNPHG